MIERDLAEEFDEYFNHFVLWKPNNREAGWPDRGIQLHASVLVWCELKTTRIRSDGKILLSNFEKEQAAFMYKWTKQGGYCFVLIAILDRYGDKMGYGVIRPIIFNDWLKVRQKLYSVPDLIPFETMEQVLNWFRATYISQDRYVKRE
jgi:hypothetical protein